MFSPRIDKIEMVRKGKKRRAKLYFLRERRGKSAKLKERRFIKESVKKKASPVPDAGPIEVPGEAVTSTGEDTTTQTANVEDTSTE